MGAQNVAKVFANWRHLSHREARALAFMANMALDADKPPVYFGGWEAVANAIGLDTVSKRSSSKEVFRQTIAKLSLEGAIVSSYQARLGVRAEYALALEPKVTYAKADCGRSGSGRGVTWVAISREQSGDAIGQKFLERPNETLPQVPQQNIAPPANETLPHLGQQDVGDCPNETLPPMSTEEPQGGLQEEKQGGLSSGSSYVTREPTRAKENAGKGSSPIEAERNRQLNALEALIENQKAAS
ncbi:hypothetical protein AB0O52_11440 [Arthrobacter sp. NPDC080073]|uniref:hypothetical protein n=1 Tax=Arthrobacter sp. NPDC080073 TaxID=3155919 RepID=UPI00343E768A